MSALLDVNDLEVRYGGVTALRDVSLAIGSGEVVGLIGPNGAGKSTLLAAVTGLVRPAGGAIRFAGESLFGVSPHGIARRGIARTYQTVRLFSRLTLRENVVTGMFAGRSRLADADVEDLAARVGMVERDLERPASVLPYADGRRLEIARALAAAPRLLLLDEPAAGMNPHETAALGSLIRALAADGTSVLLVEHDMALVRSVCSRLVVLDFGAVIASGATDDVVRDAAVIEAYLGPSAAASDRA